MAAALNGMAVSKIRAFGGTFFNFSDYMRPSLRLAALMELPTIYVFTTTPSAWAKTAHSPTDRATGLAARHAWPDAAPAADATKW